MRLDEAIGQVDVEGRLSYRASLPDRRAIYQELFATQLNLGRSIDDFLAFNLRLFGLQY